MRNSRVMGRSLSIPGEQRVWLGVFRESGVGMGVLDGQGK